MHSMMHMRDLYRHARYHTLGAHQSVRWITCTATTNNANEPLPPPWRASNVLDEWVQREARPISLRQLTFFGRTLTESRLLSSANYVRVELPTRLAHRLRNMQTLPYAALANPRISHVYELYYRAFELFRKVREIQSLEENDRFCDVIKLCLTEHLSVIPQLVMGILEIQSSVSSEECDRFISTLLRSRISRRVIAEQHLSLTETFHSPWHFPNAQKRTDGPEDECVGEILLKCNAAEIVNKCGAAAQELCRAAYGPDVTIPEIVLNGHLETSFPYMPSHLEYIIGELLRNSIQATIKRHTNKDEKLAPINVLICEAAQHVIIRVSDQAGGIDPNILPYIWSFAKGPRKGRRLENLSQVPRLAATMQETQHPSDTEYLLKQADGPQGDQPSSLGSLSSRPPRLRLGIGLPMSKIYAQYWAGSLELHSLEGYGTDAFLQISRLGNKNETVTTRATMDAV